MLASLLKCCSTQASFSFAFLIGCYGFDSDGELRGHSAEHVCLRGNELKQRGRAVMWVGMQFGVASQTSANTHRQTSLFLSLPLCLFLLSCSWHLLMETHLQGIHSLHSYLHTQTYRSPTAARRSTLQSFTQKLKTLYLK